MYLQHYALAFFCFYFIDKKNAYSWLLLSILCSMLKCNAELFDVTNNVRYIIRCSLILSCGIYLLKQYTLVAGYQAFILLVFLFVNLAMLSKASDSNYFYVNFEAIIYGLVGSQFLAIVPRVWGCFVSWLSVYFADDENKKVVYRL